MISKAEQKITYPLSLLLSIDRKKTAESLSKTCEISGDTMLRILENKSIKSTELINLATKFFGTNCLYFLLDDTTLEKMYSQLIESSADNYDASKGLVYRSLCPVVGMVSNGRYALPVIHDFWIKKEMLKKDGKYKTKVEIAKEIIEIISQSIRIKTVIVDGLYATKEMLRWLEEKNIRYEMRFHSNRLIQINPESKPVKVRDCEALKLTNKRRAKTVKILWDGIIIYVTAVKRINKKGVILIVYQVSNAKLSAREHIQLYDYRWNIEVFFRTAKQSLGLSECQSRKSLLQSNHIYNVFFAYCILQFEKRKKHLKNPEAALRFLKRKNYRALASYLSSLDQIFQTFGAPHA